MSEPTFPDVLRHPQNRPMRTVACRVGQRRQPLPAEEDRRAAVGVEHAAQLRLQRSVDTSAREVRGAVPCREAALGPPLGDQETPSSVPDIPSRVTLQLSGVVNETR
jgi:hypothetical protein